MINHVKNITIHNYKGIHELSLPNLNHINLLTGNNNTGKTSLLELLTTIREPYLFSSWLACTRRASNKYSTFSHNSSLYESFLNLFPNTQDADLELSYDFTDAENTPHIVRIKGQKITGTLLLSRKNGPDRIADSLNLTCCMDGKQSQTLQIIEGQRSLPGKPLHTDGGQIIYIPTVYQEDADKYLNQLLTDWGKKQLLLEILKSFEENIADMIPTPTSYGAVSYIIVPQTGRALPLDSYGDGMKKAVLLLGAMIQAKDGILLIDEFETGIHTSCMERVFQLLMESAIHLNVQIFMTSHSKEAISKVLRLPETIQNKISLFTLYRYEGKNYVRHVSCQEAIEMEEQLELELR